MLAHLCAKMLEEHALFGVEIHNIHKHLKSFFFLNQHALAGLGRTSLQASYISVNSEVINKPCINK